MNRRSFLAGSACALGVIASHPLLGEDAPVPLRLHIDPNQSLGRIPVDFTGLGYEISSVAIPGLLAPANSAYIQLVRTLGRHGVIRIGGNTSDYSSFAPDGQLVSAPKATVINSESLRQLGRFLDVTGWKLIWGLNLGSGTEQQAVQEAQAVASVAGNKLLAFQIGNEPDLFAHEGHRPAGYNYAQYLQEYRRYKAAIRARLPVVPFAGPDVAVATDWAARFAKDEGRDLALLTHHYYRGGASNPKSTLTELLAPAPRLNRMLEAMRLAARDAGIPYRIVETNSFSGGGKRGVSDTFGSALWALDYMLTLASRGAAGLNMETGMNQLGFISPYSPIMDDQHGHYSAAPDYYGMLGLAQLAGGERLLVNCDVSGLNVTAYATKVRGELITTIVNKDARAVEATISGADQFRRAAVMHLSAPSLYSKTGVTLGDAPVEADGKWRVSRTAPARFQEGYRIRILAGSAAFVTLHNQ